jgi:hypothetical protein
MNTPTKKLLKRDISAQTFCEEYKRDYSLKNGNQLYKYDIIWNILDVFVRA